MTNWFPRRLGIALLAWMVLLTGCASSASRVSVSSAPSATRPTAAAVPATQEVATASPTPPAVQATPDPARPLLWVSPALPKAIRDRMQVQSMVQLASSRESATLRLEINPSAPVPGQSTTWIYALVTPFPSMVDEVSRADLRAAWNGKSTGSFNDRPLLMTAETSAALESWWGSPASGAVQVIDETALLDTAWNNPPAWAIIPFEQIAPRWKVLRVDGQSPLEKSFAADHYPLALPVGLSGSADVARGLTLPLPANRDPHKLTVLVMTGTTAISRHIAERMEAKGMTYPAQAIGDSLSEADLTHISNEVPFYKDCPKAGPDRADMRFCSSPKYIQLLEAAGTDIVELTGNHILDWGYQPFLDTLEMYRQRGWKTFGGGANLEDAKKPLYIEHNGNKLVFLGCSPAGPAPVWASQYTPGSAPCNFDRLEQQVRVLRASGYLPIITYQAVETDDYVPTAAQGTPNFRRMAAAGAVIVSGSQSHVPQTMTFVGSSFVHYGLGNLFFDQMDPPRDRQEFIDRHVFYDGKYLGVELLTALLEDYSQPRPMTTSERADFLSKIFSLSDWNGKYP